MKRRQSEKNKKLADDARLMRAWRNWHAEQLTEALVGLHEVNAAICKLRERLDQEPIDDALVELGEPLRAFQLIRNIMNQFPVPAGEPTSGNGLNRTIAEESKCHE